MTLRASLAVTLACCASMTVAWGQEKPLTMAQLPAAVRAAVQQELSQGAQLRGLSTDTEDGQREYEALLTVHGRRRDVAYSASGKELETEDTVPLTSLPQAARDALQQAGAVLAVEQVSQEGKFVAYEAQIRKKNGKHAEVRVDRAGHEVPDNG